MPTGVTGVLIVEDSPTVRLYLREVVEADPGMMVVGEAADGQGGVEAVLRLRPDIVLMDINMPRLDGVDATRQIMELRPTPILVFCGRADAEGVARSFKALQVGAMALIEKPNAKQGRSPDDVGRELLARIRVLSGVRAARRRAVALPAPAPRVPQLRGAPSTKGLQILAVAASTGGPAAAAKLLGALPGDFPVPILFAQHMSPGFTQGLADWLDGEMSLRVVVATSRELPQPGRVYLAPDGLSLSLGAGGHLICDGRPVDALLRPSADLLFASVATARGSSAIGVVLTGMGDDGALGLAKLRATGARTYAQTPASCVVGGMPSSAIAAGGVGETLDIDRIARRLLDAAEGRPT